MSFLITDSSSSPGRLAESAPHILQEDRVILESVFASRNAITDLRNTTRKSHEHTSSTSSAGTVDIPTFEPGAHGRNLSTATGVDIPSFEDVLPHGSAKGKQRSTEDPLARRFSRRGVRLAVHSSILDLNSHDIPSSLRKRWIRKARLRRSLEQQDLGCPLDAQLSRISKVNSSPSAKDVEDPFALRQTENIPEDSQQKQSGERGSEEVTPRNVSKAKKRSLTLMATPMGKTIGRVIKRLGTTNLNQAEKKDDGTTRMNQIEGNNKDKQRLGTTSLTPIEGRDEGKLEDETERSPDKA